MDSICTAESTASGRIESYIDTLYMLIVHKYTLHIVRKESYKCNGITCINHLGRSFYTKCKNYTIKLILCISMYWLTY